MARRSLARLLVILLGLAVSTTGLVALAAADDGEPQESERPEQTTTTTTSSGSSTSGGDTTTTTSYASWNNTTTTSSSGSSDGTDWGDHEGASTTTTTYSGPGDGEDSARADEFRERYRAWQEEQEARWARERAASADRARDLEKLFRDEGPDGVRGGFHLANGTADGVFVDLTIDAANGFILSYSVRGTVFFASIELPGPVEETSLHGHEGGNRLRVEGDGWRVEVLDQPTGNLLFVAEGDGIAFFTPAAGGNVTEHGNGFAGWALEVGGEKGFLVTPRRAEVGNDTAGLPVAGRGFFHSPVVRATLPGVANLNREDIEEAVSSDAVGAEVTIVSGEAGVDAQTVDYAGMTIDVGQGENDSLVLTLDAEVEGARLIVVNLGHDVIAGEGFTVRYYDVLDGAEVEIPIGRAVGLASILDLASGGTLPSYWPVADVDGEQVILYVPHFSVHKVILESASVLEVLQRPVVVWGVIGAVGAVLAAGWWAARPRDEEEP